MVSSPARSCRGRLRGPAARRASRSCRARSARSTTPDPTPGRAGTTSPQWTTSVLTSTTIATAAACAARRPTARAWPGSVVSTRANPRRARSRRGRGSRTAGRRADSRRCSSASRAGSLPDRSRDREPALVEHADETGRTTARRDVAVGRRHRRVASSDERRARRRSGAVTSSMRATFLLCTTGDGSRYSARAARRRRGSRSATRFRHGRTIRRVSGARRRGCAGRATG